MGLYHHHHQVPRPHPAPIRSRSVREDDLTCKIKNFISLRSRELPERKKLVVNHGFFGANLRNGDVIWVVAGLSCELDYLFHWTHLGCGIVPLEENVAIAQATVCETLGMEGHFFHGVIIRIRIVDTVQKARRDILAGMEICRYRDRHGWPAAWKSRWFYLEPTSPFPKFWRFHRHRSTWNVRLSSCLIYLIRAQFNSYPVLPGGRLRHPLASEIMSELINAASSHLRISSVPPPKSSSSMAPSVFRKRLYARFAHRMSRYLSHASSTILLSHTKLFHCCLVCLYGERSLASCWTK